MKTIITWTAAITLTLAALAFAGVPQTINYQGYLKSAAGTPVTTATPVRFSLYSSTPARNNPVWRETKDVSPVNGIYSTQLGSTTPITAPFDVPYYLLAALVITRVIVEQSIAELAHRAPVNVVPINTVSLNKSDGERAVVTQLSKG